MIISWEREVLWDICEDCEDWRECDDLEDNVADSERSEATSSISTSELAGVSTRSSSGIESGTDD